MELFDQTLTSLGVFPINTSSLISFSEGLFSYVGTPVSRAVLDLDDSAGRFAFDNLVYERQAAVPEPAGLTLLGIGALGAIGFTRCRRKHAA